MTDLCSEVYRYSKRFDIKCNVEVLDPNDEEFKKIYEKTTNRFSDPVVEAIRIDDEHPVYVFHHGERIYNVFNPHKNFTSSYYILDHAIRFAILKMVEARLTF